MAFSTRKDKVRWEAAPAAQFHDIQLSKADHRKPYPGDHGVLFDPKDKDAADYAAMIFDED